MGVEVATTLAQDKEKKVEMQASSILRTFNSKVKQITRDKMIERKINLIPRAKYNPERTKEIPHDLEVQAYGSKMNSAFMKAYLADYLDDDGFITTNRFCQLKEADGEIVMSNVFAIGDVAKHECVSIKNVDHFFFDFRLLFMLS